MWKNIPMLFVVGKVTLIPLAVFFLGIKCGLISQVKNKEVVILDKRMVEI
jgi:hypothetical protein